MDISTVIIVIGVISLFVLEAFFELAFFSAIGAFIRWIFGKRKESLRKLYQSKTKQNIIVGLIGFLVILAIPLATFAIINN